MLICKGTDGARDTSNYRVASLLIEILSNGEWPDGNGKILILNLKVNWD